MTLRFRLFLSTLATLVGVSSLWLYTTLSKEVLFEGVGYCTSTFGQLFLIVLAILGSAVVSGFLAALIVIRKTHWPHIWLSLVLLIQMALVATSCSDVNAPMWFEASQNISLLGGVWLGAFAAGKFPLAPM
ncbi:MAG: hypothetical protein AAGL29_07455 [Bacteroidota bacterium]